MRHPQGVLGFREGVAEIVRVEVQCGCVERQHALAEMLHGVQVGRHRLPEPRQCVRLGPRIGAAVAHPRHHVRMIGRKIPLEKERLHEVGARRFLHPGAAGHVPVHRHVSDVVLVAADRHLLGQRPLVKTSALGEDVVDECLGYAVSVDVIEAHLLQRLAQLGRQALARAGNAGEKIGHLQDGDAALRRGVELGFTVRDRHDVHPVGSIGMPSGAAISKALSEQARPTYPPTMPVSSASR